MSDYACMRRLGEIFHNVHANAIPSFDLLHAVVDHATAHCSYFHVLFEVIRWHICVPLLACRIYLRSVKQFPTGRGTGFPSLGSAVGNHANCFAQVVYSCPESLLGLKVCA
jgi:hypothetical protein